MSLMTDLMPWTRGRGNELQRATPDSFAGLQRQINRVFDDAWRDFDLPMARLGREHMGWPSVELNDRDKELTLVAELPGMKEQDVEVLLEDDAVILRGERKGEHHDEDRHFTERYYGRFERRIPLPAEVQADKVDAQFKDGLLTINMPKTANGGTRGRRIPINQH